MACDVLLIITCFDCFDVLDKEETGSKMIMLDLKVPNKPNHIH
jgi:hypothetical protein